MSKKYPRIPVGDGKYCYSGPNCRKHGGKSVSVVTMNAPKTIQQKIEGFIERHNAKISELVFKAICENSDSMKDLADMGDKALLKGQAAKKCYKHNMYHVYSISEMNIFSEQLKKPIKVMLKGEYDKGNITGPQVGEFSNYCRLNADIAFANSMAEDKVTLKKFQQEFINSGLAEKAKELRDAESEANRIKSTWVAKEVIPYSPPLIPESKINDNTMMEYWQCGRKTVRASLEASNAAIISQKEQGEMTAYKCKHCPNYHIGHGTGSDPVSDQLVRARKHWTDFPEKSNVFIKSKNLV